MGNITRRSFLQVVTRLLTFFGLTAVLAPIVAFFYPTELEEMPSEPVMAGDLASLPVGEAMTVRFGRYPALVLHAADGLHAYSAVCTHFACIVKWDPVRGEIVCPCHEGYFDPQDGSVISGPPPEPLTSLSVEIVDGRIFVGDGA
jgi:nitrite reductase/ring-hydroxylating ferredoxin subunit